MMILPAPAALPAGRTDVRRQLVLPEAALTVAAVDHGVRERFDVPARLPHLRMHQDGRIEADDIVALLHHRPPPGALDVVRHLDAQRTVIPRALQAAVDLAALEHEAAPFAQPDERLHIDARLHLGLVAQSNLPPWPGDDSFVPT